MKKATGGLEIEAMIPVQALNKLRELKTKGCRLQPAQTRWLRRHLKSAIALLVLCTSAFHGSGQSFAEFAPATAQRPPDAMKPRYQDYLQVKQKARAWFDDLEVDSVDLLKHRVKGKKKVAEILGAYINFLNHTKDPQEIAPITARVKQIVEQTNRPEYHKMGTCSEQELIQNSMSYFRVMWLMREFGLDVSHYLDEVRKVKPRMDEHFKRRGPWQKAMFAEYYDRFGLELPPILNVTAMKKGVVARRLPANRIDDPSKTLPTGRVKRSVQDSYDLTHEVFVAFNYGLERTQTRFDADDLAYTRKVLPVLVRRYIREENPDLVAELLSCMTYLGRHSEPAYREGVNFLLDVQNADGTWGDYEKHREWYGKYLDQHVYLHTTMVAMRALLEVYEGNWKAAE